MKQLIVLSIMFAFTTAGYAQNHIRQAIDDMIAKHPEWIVSHSKNETQTPSGTQTNRLYQLSITAPTVVDSLLAAFDADKLDGYNYIRTSAAYNQAIQKRRRTTVTLQNGERLESHSTTYSFVSLSVVNSENKSCRTNYILKWFPTKDGRTEAKLYILYGPRPNNQ